MAKPTPTAGGCFLIIAILAGFAIGVFRGNPVGGTLIGLIGGTVIAILVWLVDSARIAKRQRLADATLDGMAPDRPPRGDGPLGSSDR